MPPNKNSFIVSFQAYIVRNWERENSSIISRKTLIGSWGGDIYLSFFTLSNQQTETQNVDTPVFLQYSMHRHNQRNMAALRPSAFWTTIFAWAIIYYKSSLAEAFWWFTKSSLPQNPRQENYTWSCYKWGIIKISIMIASGMKSAYKKHI